MLLFIFPLCKFFESQVQVPMGFLTRPVTGYKSCYDPGHSEEQYDQDRGLHMIKVPCILPSIKLIAIALTNMPVMIHTMSIISVPKCPGVSLSGSR